MKKSIKGGVLIILMALIVQMTFMSAFFMAVPAAVAQEANLCAVDVDAVLIMDRSGSMEAGSCEWWDSKKQPEPGYVTDYGVSEGWCDVRDNFDHPSTYTPDSPTDLESAQAAANSFLNFLGTNDQSALVSFASDVSLDKQLSNDHSATESAVNSLSVGGATNIGDAIDSGTTELGSARANPSAVKVMILLTDGRANKPNGDGSGEDVLDVAYAESMASAAGALGFKIFTIGLGDNVNDTMLGNIASVTGGTYYQAPSQEDLESIYNTIAEDICEYGSISGCKYNDVDNIGVIDDGEEKLSGWEIQLIGCPYPADGFGYLPKDSIVTDPEPGQSEYCVVMDTTFTGDDGCYSFTGLEGSSYGVSEVVSDGWYQTYPANDEFYYFNLDESEAKENIDFANREIPEEPEVLTINAFKVVCEAEEYLPNWGAVDPVTGEPSTVTETTASDYVAYINNLNEREVCALESGWDFQWGLDDKDGQEGVDLLPGGHVGEADGTDTSAMCSEPWCGLNTNTGDAYDEWKTFGSTDENGLAAAEIRNLFGAAGIWVREVLKEGFISFTHPPKDPDVDNVSAELYCQSDIVNYDNYDLIENVQMGETYNCVAFNAPLETPEPVCGNNIKEGDEECDGTDVPEGKTCLEDCTIKPGGGGGAICGDNKINQTSEECDGTDTPEGKTCSEDCKLIEDGPRCGDNIVNQSSEECDGTDTPAGKSCNSNCQVSGGGGGGGGGGLLIPTNRGGETPVVLGEEGEPVLTIEKTNEREFVNPGEQGIRYTIRVSNTGNLTAFNTVLVDVLPEGLSFADTEGDTKTWELGDLEAGDTMEFTYMVDVDTDASAQVYANTAEASADNHDPVIDSAEVEVLMVEVLAESGFSKNELLVLVITLVTIFNVIHFMKRKEA